MFIACIEFNVFLHLQSFCDTQLLNRSRVVQFCTCLMGNTLAIVMLLRRVLGHTYCGP